MRPIEPIAIVAATALTALAQPEPTLDRFVDWAAENAVHIDRWESSPRLEAELDRLTEGKRIVFIGEPDHFFREKYDVQLLLIGHLAERGFTHIFEEGFGTSTAPAVDQFIATGERPGVRDDADDDVQRYRRKAIEGWTGAKNSQFRIRTSAERRRFNAGLIDISRALPEGQRIHIHPLDIDMMPGGCYHELNAILDAHAGDDSLDAVRALVAKPDGESVDDEIAHLESLRDLIETDPDKALAALTPNERRKLFRHADCLVETIVFFDTSRKDGELNRALIRREGAMFRAAKHAIDDLPDDAKMIFIAHNNHLCRVADDIGRARKPSVGQMIDEAYPGRVASIWMLINAGWHLNPMDEKLIVPLEPDPERIEHRLAEVGPTFLLPLGTGDHAETYLDSKRVHSYFSWQEESTLTKQADALIVLDNITEPRTADQPLARDQLDGEPATGSPKPTG